MQLWFQFNSWNLNAQLYLQEVKNYRIMLRCLPFKQMLVLTMPWALPNFGLGLVVLHEVHLSLERSFVSFRDDLVAIDRKIYMRCICISFICPIHMRFHFWNLEINAGFKGDHIHDIQHSSPIIGRCVWVIFISHSMVTVYTFKIINLFYHTKVMVLFRVCLGEVHVFKIWVAPKWYWFFFLYL
jgi:hypothetical protein